jgi:prepilin-type N-terminal cleavage/methylation domain-containing protein
MYSKLIKIKNSFVLFKNKGLTLIELLVVISIFMIITSVAIFNYGNFSSTVSLQNLTDDIALSIRKAQSFAIGARAIKESNDAVDFNQRYGVHFSMNETLESPLAGSTKSFLMFSSLNKEYVESTSACGSVSNECIELFDITSVDKIEGIKAYDGVGNLLTNSSTSSIDIVFTRPDPKANFCYKEFSNSTCNTSVSRVDIIITNDKLDQEKRIKTISVQNTGQISIQ